jgi:hypothetical protein
MFRADWCEIIFPSRHYVPNTMKRYEKISKTHEVKFLTISEPDELLLRSNQQSKVLNFYVLQDFLNIKWFSIFMFYKIF